MKKNRLHSLCPYFAMFPEEFVRSQIRKFTNPGDLVFDPFSGRGTTVLEALLLGRRAAALDINPVAYCISGAKARPPKLKVLLKRLNELEAQYRATDRVPLEAQRRQLSVFFRKAFHRETFFQLLFLRDTLLWRRSSIDRFVAALVLGSLHGEMDKSSSYFSNQMPRTISTKPGYSVRYWKTHKLTAPKRDVFSILHRRAELRLSGGVPSGKGLVIQADARDSTIRLPQLGKSVAAIVTSPPYLDVTKYEEDQWLRLWFLGHSSVPTYNVISHDDRHTSPDRYWAFLKDTWIGMLGLVRAGTVLVCRLGAKGISTDELIENFKTGLLAVFPSARRLRREVISGSPNRQTEYFRPGSKGCLHEVDFTYQLQ